jgi:mannose-1-phosphate guanylyltransferase
MTEDVIADRLQQLSYAGFLWNSGTFMFRASVLLGGLSNIEDARRSAKPGAISASLRSMRNHLKKLCRFQDYAVHGKNL